MTTTVKAKLNSCQGNSLGLHESAEDKELVLFRELLKESVEESRLKKEFVAAAMGLTGPEYLSKLFSGEKPIAARHIVGLPDQVEAIFARKWAERFGHVVVAPLTGPEAVKALVAGLVGVFGQLPAKASHMAKAGVSSEQKSEVA